MWKHVGIYAGNGKVIESTGAGPSETDLAAWVDPDVSPKRKWVDYLRVNTDQATRDRAVNFARSQAGVGKGYDYNYAQRDSRADSNSGYCSELVWAAYLNASNNNIDLADAALAKLWRLPSSWQLILATLDYTQKMKIGITPTDISISHHVTRIGGHNTRLPIVSLFKVVFNCPVDLEVIDPQGRVVNIEANDIPGATYGRDIDENGELRSWVGIPERQAGNYQVRAIPWSVAVPEDTYSATVELEDGTATTLANEVQMSAMPTQPYVYVSVSKPVLKLALDETKWNSYADYTARLLSANYTVVNAGNVTALNTSITSQSLTNDVTLSSPTLPYAIGDLPQGESASFETKVFIPAGVTAFKTHTQAVCADETGQSYYFPGAPPG